MSQTDRCNGAGERACNDRVTDLKMAKLVILRNYLHLQATLPWMICLPWPFRPNYPPTGSLQRVLTDRLLAVTPAVPQQNLSKIWYYLMHDTNVWSCFSSFPRLRLSIADCNSVDTAVFNCSTAACPPQNSPEACKAFEVQRMYS